MNGTLQSGKVERLP